MTNGLITLGSGGIFNGTRTDANGTISPPVTYNLQLANIVVGSRYQIYNVTASSELTNALSVSGGIDVTYTKGTDYTAGDVGRYRITYQSGVNAKETLEGAFTFPTDSAINSLPTSQLPNGSYETFAIDGAGISEFSWDSGNVEVDINDSDNNTSIQRFGAWYTYFITTAVGIDEAFGAVEWETLNSIQIYSAIVDVKLDNTKASPLVLTGGRIYRNDGLTVIAAASNSIQIDYNPVYTVETGVSGLTPAESTKLTDIASDTDELQSNQANFATADISGLETKAEADASEFALVAQHAVTQAEIADLSNVSTVTTLTPGQTTAQTIVITVTPTIIGE